MNTRASCTELDPVASATASPAVVDTSLLSTVCIFFVVVAICYLMYVSQFVSWYNENFMSISHKLHTQMGDGGLSHRRSMRSGSLRAAFTETHTRGTLRRHKFLLRHGDQLPRPFCLACTAAETTEFEQICTLRSETGLCQLLRCKLSALLCTPNTITCTRLASLIGTMGDNRSYYISTLLRDLIKIPWDICVNNAY